MMQSKDRPGLRVMQSSRRYRVEFWLAMGSYLLLCGVLTLVIEEDRDLWMWLLLYVPILGAFIAILRAYVRADEFQRFRMLQGMSVGFASAMLTSLAIGLLGTTGMATPWAGWIIYSAGMSAFGLTACLRSRGDA